MVLTKVRTVRGFGQRFGGGLLCCRRGGLPVLLTLLDGCAAWPRAGRAAAMRRRRWRRALLRRGLLGRSCWHCSLLSRAKRELRGWRRGLYPVRSRRGRWGGRLVASLLWALVAFVSNGRRWMQAVAVSRGAVSLGRQRHASPTANQRLAFMQNTPAASHCAASGCLLSAVGMDFCLCAPLRFDVLAFEMQPLHTFWVTLASLPSLYSVSGMTPLPISLPTILAFCAFPVWLRWLFRPAGHSPSAWALEQAFCSAHTRVAHLRTAHATLPAQRYWRAYTTRC